MGACQLSHSPRRPTCWGATYNNTAMTRCWAVAASYWNKCSWHYRQAIKPRFLNLSTANVLIQKTLRCRWQPCACRMFNNTLSLYPLAASSTALQVMTMSRRCQVSPRGERCVCGKIHPQLRATEFKKKSGNEDLVKTRLYCLPKCF